MALSLKSPAFVHGQEIPVRHTGDGQNLSPPLEWSDLPEGTKSVLISMDDPDAPKGTFHHWAVYDVRPEAGSLDEGGGNDTRIAAQRQAVNDFGHRAYDGPSPPKGHGTHHYRIRIAALDVEQLPVADAVDVRAVWRAAESHLLGTAEIVGLYGRA